MRNVPLYVIGASMALLAYLIYFHKPPVTNTDEYLFWGKMHIILSTVPAVIYFSGFTTKNTFPFIAFVAFFQMINFGIPVFFIRINSFQMNQSLNVDAMEMGFWGLLIFYTTYFSLYKYVFQRIKSFAPIPATLNPVYYNVLIAVVLLIYTSSRFFDLASIKQLGSFTLYVYVGFTILKIFRKRANLLEIWLFIGVMIFELIDRVTSGLIAELANFILFLCLVIFLEGSKRYLIAVCIIPFLIFYSQFSAVKGAYRKIAWFGTKQLSYEERVDLIAELIEKNEKQVNYEDKEGKDNFLWRFSYPMAALSLVITKTPSEVPYWDGTTYLPIFTKFIPRALWPSKPEEDMGQRFGQTYRILKPRDKSTSINTPILSELYMNFGVNGFYIGMFALGIFFIFLDKFFNNKLLTYDNQIVNMSIIFPFINMESNFSLVFGNLFLICVSLFIIFRLIKD
jgi:hypothetical protein